MAKYFRFPFAAQGDRIVFPDDTQPNGSLSYNQGYGPDFQRTPGTDPQARRVDRSRFNQLVNDITSTLQLYYQEGVPPYITAAENGGSNFEYPIYARVRYDSGSGDRIYESLINNNNNLPTVTNAWRLVDFAGLDARYVAGTLGTANGNIPQIGTPGTTTAGNRSAVVVRSGSNSSGNYNVFSHGLIIQSSVSRITQNRMNHTITLPISFNLSNYIVLTTDEGLPGAPRAQVINGRMTNQFNAFSDGTNNQPDTFHWLSIGF